MARTGRADRLTQTIITAISAMMVGQPFTLMQILPQEVSYSHELVSLRKPNVVQIKLANSMLNGRRARSQNIRAHAEKTFLFGPRNGWKTLHQM